MSEITNDINGFLADVFGEETISATGTSNGNSDFIDDEPDFSYNPHSDNRPENGNDDDNEDDNEDSEDIDLKKSSKADNKNKKSIKVSDIEDDIEGDDEDANEDDDKEATHTTSFDIENEEALTEGVFQLFMNKAGLDIDEEDTPKSMDEFIEYINTVIDENSIPEYASEEVKSLDEFVRNGGNLKDYIKMEQSLNFDGVDMDNETNQKMAVRALLEEKGFNKAQIDKKIDKYEIAGILADEAEDAVEELKDIREKRQSTLLNEQKKLKEESEKAQQRIYEDVVQTIKSLDNIGEIKISNKDKKELLQYMFEPNKNGRTQFQEDGKDIKNFVMSAYFMKSGKTLIDSAAIKGKSEALKKIQQNIRMSAKSKSREDAISSARKGDALSSISNVFGGPNSRH